MRVRPWFRERPGRRPALRGARLLTAGAIGALALAGCGGGSSGSSTGAARGGGSARAPSGPLIGAMFDGPVLGNGVDLGRQMDLAVASGVESLRVPVQWSSMQPVGGASTDFASLDRIVSAAAPRHLALLPVVLSTPKWANGGRGGSVPPSSPASYAAFLTALVKRYGPDGSFWATHPTLPRVPIRTWQIWNEPNFTRYWSVQPFAQSYVRLLSAAHAAIKAADPGAQVVLGGFPEFSWRYLAEIYAIPGARDAFDVAAVHPYTAQPAGVITILNFVRDAMKRAGDGGKPLLATEITWPSSQGKAPPQFGVGTTEAEQARLLGRLMPLLQANRARLGLTGFYWYTWMGDESPNPNGYGFDYAGLLKYVSGQVSVKPALAVFKHWALSLEGCNTKSGSAAACG